MNRRSSVALLSLWLASGCGARPSESSSQPRPEESRAVAAQASACTGEGGKLFAKSKEERCCAGLVRVSAEDIPRSDYAQDDYPRGCGPRPATPPDLMYCLACGDGVCGLGEHFCNCPADCRSGQLGPALR